MFRAALFALAFVAAISSLAPTTALAAEASFAGKWNLDLERSDPRRQGQPLVATLLTLELDGEDMTAIRDFGGGRTFTLNYVTDGKPQDVETPFGHQTLRSKWKKDKFTVSYTVSRGGFDVDTTESWAVKGSELIVSFSTRMGDRNLVRKEIYVRADG